MASTFHLGAYHELADTFTLGFEKRKKKERSRILSFFYELPSFFLFPTVSPQNKRCNTAEISPPDGQRLYKQPPPGSGNI